VGFDTQQEVRVCLSCIELSRANAIEGLRGSMEDQSVPGRTPRNRRRSAPSIGGTPRTSDADEEQQGEAGEEVTARVDFRSRSVQGSFTSSFTSDVDFNFLGKDVKPVKRTKSSDQAQTLAQKFEGRTADLLQNKAGSDSSAPSAPKLQSAAPAKKPEEPSGFFSGLLSPRSRRKKSPDPLEPLVVELCESPSKKFEEYKCKMQLQALKMLSRILQDGRNRSYTAVVQWSRCATVCSTVSWAKGVVAEVEKEGEERRKEMQLEQRRLRAEIHVLKEKQKSRWGGWRTSKAEDDAKNLMPVGATDYEQVRNSASTREADDDLDDEFLRRQPDPQTTCFTGMLNMPWVQRARVYFEDN